MDNAFLIDLEQRTGADGDRAIRFTDDELHRLTADDADQIIAHFDGQAMMYFPSWEVTFFDWLKREDPEVWEDLWGGEAEPYVVSIEFLQAFVDEGHGFPICDLVAHDNYYFHRAFLTEPDGKQLLEIIMDKVRKQERIELAEAFLMEMMQHPIDIWRFAYKYHVPIATAKGIADDYARDGVILHPTETGELGDFVEL